MQIVKPLPRYDPALHSESVQTTWSSPKAALHPDCSGKSTMIRLPWTEVTVPTLEYVTEPQPYCGRVTDGSTLTRLPTWSDCEHSEEEGEQVVAPVVAGVKKGQSAKVACHCVTWGKPLEIWEELPLPMRSVMFCRTGDCKLSCPRGSHLVKLHTSLTDRCCSLTRLQPKTHPTLCTAL